MERKLSDGFTLIELLTVMSIIAILVAISVFSLAGARESGRDARRKADIESIASALELYKADCNFYPNAIPAPGNQFTGVLCSLGANIYMEAIPDDTLAGQDYTYQPLSCTGVNCTRFRIWAALEDPGPVPGGCVGTPTCGSVTCNFCVTNP